VGGRDPGIAAQGYANIVQWERPVIGFGELTPPALLGVLSLVDCVTLEETTALNPGQLCGIDSGCAYRGGGWDSAVGMGATSRRLRFSPANAGFITTERKCNGVIIETPRFALDHRWSYDIQLLRDITVNEFWICRRLRARATDLMNCYAGSQSKIIPEKSQ